MEKHCQRCNASRVVGAAERFCSTCGTELIAKKSLPYIGVSQSKGVYRISCVVEHEFRSEDAANEAARHASFGEECEQQFPNPKVELVQLTCTKETHPFICGSCSEKSPKWAPVSEGIDGRCEDCGDQNWIARK